MSENIIKINVGTKPVLDPGFIPAVLWNKAYRDALAQTGEARKIVIALERNSDSISTYATEIFPHIGGYRQLNIKYVERLIKSLLWLKGGYKLIIAGCDLLVEDVRKIYSVNGARSFDCEIIGKRIYDRDFEVVACLLSEAPKSSEVQMQLGGHTDGCHIGFDLGGSDRKCAAVMDGKVIFTEEVAWNPYFESNPEYHRHGILDSIKRAAERLPRVDAIGGSAAGTYINNVPRVASLFRGVSEEDFKNHIQNIFTDIQKKYNVPLIVANDGEVTALAGSLTMKVNAVFGVSMGTSMAGGYVTAGGSITDWLNEPAFAPVDYRDNAPVDEWSGDRGCGVQYFSQHAVARLAQTAGIILPEDMPFPDQLLEMQRLMEQDDIKARKIYETIGVYLAYSIAHYAEFYELENLLILGRVTSGPGGDLMLEVAENVLTKEFPLISSTIKLSTPNEQFKRHGQAVIAASLPPIIKSRRLNDMASLKRKH
jgi:predicted NBD/HSP70 family sugar kinase